MAFRTNYRLALRHPNDQRAALLRRVLINPDPRASSRRTGSGVAAVTFMPPLEQSA